MRLHAAHCTLTAVLLVLTWAGAAAALQALHGRVIRVDGLTVEIGLESQALPSAGDRVEIRVANPEAGEIAIGTWKVRSARPGLVTAEVVEHTGTPAVGQSAVIFSTGAAPAAAGPAPSPSVPASRRPASPEPAPPASAAWPANAPASPYRTELASGEAQQIREAARAIMASWDFSPAVLADVDRALRQGYAVKENDRLHVDAMAWLCRVLGAGGDSRYRATLRMVAAEAPQRKLRQYAGDSLRRLP